MSIRLTSTVEVTLYLYVCRISGTGYQYQDASSIYSGRVPSTRLPTYLSPRYLITEVTR